MFSVVGQETCEYYSRSVRVTFAQFGFSPFPVCPVIFFTAEMTALPA